MRNSTDCCRWLPWSTAFCFFALALLFCVPATGWQVATSTPAASTAAGSPIPSATPPGGSVSTVVNCGKDASSEEKNSGFWKEAGTVLVGVLPTLIWALFALWAVRFLAPQIIKLIERLRSFKGLGVELEFAIESRLEKAAETQGVTLGAIERSALRARLSLVGHLVRGMRILWVDDVPQNNLEERSILSGFGAQIQQAQSTDGALAEFAQRAFDLVISDMKRGQDTTAGLDLLTKMRGATFNAPMIIYTGTDQSNQPRPAGLFGITNRPDDLIHLVLDVAERQMIK